MAVQITVRGGAERRWAAETATLVATVALEGPEREEVAREAAQVHGELTSRLADLREAGAVREYAADSVRVLAERPWLPQGGRGELVQTARLGVRAVFADVEALSRLVGDWSADARVEIGAVTWDLTEDHRREYEALVRAEAVADAVAKAQAYADAIGAGAVQATHLADPGMLTPAEPEPRAMMKAAFADSGAGLSLRPDEIVVRCEVDARFIAG